MFEEEKMSNNKLFQNSPPDKITPCSASEYGQMYDEISEVGNNDHLSELQLDKLESPRIL